MSALQSVAARIRATKRNIELYWPARNRGTGSFRKILKYDLERLRGLYEKRERILRERASQQQRQPESGDAGRENERTS